MTDSPQRALVDQMLRSLAAGDADGIMACMSSDVSGVDEVTRSFTRGYAVMAEHIGALMGAVASVTSVITDYTETVVGDAAFATCVLEQSYVLDGVPTSVVAPTTYGFRKEGGQWKICLFHSVPIV